MSSSSESTNLTSDLLDQAAPMVENLARRRARSATSRGASLDIDDLRQEAWIGVLRAAEDWDPSRGPWVAHARAWADRQVRLAILTAGRTVTYPRRLELATARLDRKLEAARARGETVTDDALDQLVQGCLGPEDSRCPAALLAMQQHAASEKRRVASLDAPLAGSVEVDAAASRLDAVTSPLGIDSAGEASVEDLAEDELERARFNDAVAGLEPNLRHVVRLRLQDREYPEIAKVLGISPDAARARYRRAADRLKAELADPDAA